MPMPRVFSDVGALLSHPELWADWLSNHKDRARLFAETFELVVRIGAHTGWPPQEVLERLGCDTKTEQQLEGFEPERLRRCAAYMGWVETLLGELDLAADKQLTVSGAARLFVVADQDVEKADALMKAGTFAALDYLRLGELDEAWECATRHARGPAGEHARYVHDHNPFHDSATPHVSPERHGMLREADAVALLGPRVTRRMAEHIEECGVCLRAYGRRRQDPRWTESSEDPERAVAAG
ncbi:MAG TPA: hypothetical protein VG318_01380 [Actinomycetota bacterium]|nr:hypothetical protein [Actinomycetota bacterium]